jgi:hypothetical protein
MEENEDNSRENEWPMDILRRCSMTSTNKNHIIDVREQQRAPTEFEIQLCEQLLFAMIENDRRHVMSSVEQREQRIDVGHTT